MKLGTTELLIILAVVVLIFGPTQLPKLAKMIGKSVKSLRAGMSDGDDEPAESGKAPVEKKQTAGGAADMSDSRSDGEGSSGQ